MARSTMTMAVLACWLVGCSSGSSQTTRLIGGSDSGTDPTIEAASDNLGEQCRENSADCDGLGDYVKWALGANAGGNGFCMKSDWNGSDFMALRCSFTCYSDGSPSWELCLDIGGSCVAPVPGATAPMCVVP